MEYNLVFSRKVCSFIQTLPESHSHVMLSKLVSLVYDSSFSALPPPLSLAKERLKKSSPPLFKIRCGDYRVFYQIYAIHFCVAVVGLSHRKKAYKNIKDRTWSLDELTNSKCFLTLEDLQKSL